MAPVIGREPEQFWRFQGYGLLMAVLLVALVGGPRSAAAQGSAGFPGPVVVNLYASSVSVSPVVGFADAERYLVFGTQDGALSLTRFNPEFGTVNVLDNYFLEGIPVAVAPRPGGAQDPGLVVALTNPDRLVFLALSLSQPIFNPVQSMDLSEDPGTISAVSLAGGGGVGLVVSLPGLDRILVLQKAGQQWSVRQDLPAGDRPNGLAVGDMDADGRDEIYVSQSGYLSENIGIFRQDTQGTFSLGGVFSPGFTPGPVAVFDLESDGTPELVIGSQDQPVAMVVESAAGVLQEREQVDLALPAVTLHLAHLGDGGSGLTTANTAGGLVEFLAFSGGSWSMREAYYPGCLPVDCLPHDFNGDGWPDLATVGDLNGSTIMFGKGRGDFWGFPALILGGDPLGAVIASVTQEGLLDAVVIRRLSTTLTIYPGLADGGLNGTARQDPLDFQPGVIAALPATPAGYQPVVVSDPVGHRIVSLDLTRPGQPQILEAVGIGGLPSRLKTADVDGDGHGDLLVLLGNERRGVVLFSDGAGRFPVQVAQDVFFTPHGVEALDLNGDGLLDLAFSDGAKHVWFFANQGGRSFGASQSVETGEGADQLVSGDLDGDHDRDLAVVNHLDQNLTILENDGNGNLLPRIDPFDLSSPPGAIVVGDVNSDGRDELLVNLRQESRVAVVSFGAQWEYAVAQSFTGGRDIAGLTTGDLNADGKLDIFELGSSLQLGVIMLNGNRSLVAVDPRALDFACLEGGTRIAVTPDRTGPWVLAVSGPDGWIDLAGPGWSVSGVLTYDRGTWLWDTGPDFPGILLDRESQGKVMLRLTVGAGARAESLTRPWSDPCAKEEGIPSTHTLAWIQKPWPNPFNPTLTLTLKLERPDDLVVRVYDLRGRVVAELFHGSIGAGVVKLAWDGQTIGGPAASGLYLVKAATQADQLVAKIMLSR